MPYCIVRTARKLRAQGLTYAQVGEKLNVHKIVARNWILSTEDGPIFKGRAKYTQETLQTAWELRQKGLKWKLIAEHLGVTQPTATRYARMYEQQQLAKLMEPVSV